VRLPWFRHHPVSQEELSAYIDGRLSSASKGPTSTSISYYARLCEQTGRDATLSR